MHNLYTKSAKKESIKRKWHLLDAKEYKLGRLSTEVANLLNGKGKNNYTSHLDMGDFVVVINAEKVQLTGNKKSDKMYHHYSGYPGGIKSKSYNLVSSENPTRAITLAVKGMLSDNRMRNDKLKRLKVYKGEKHPHDAQFKS